MYRVIVSVALAGLLALAMVATALAQGSIRQEIEFAEILTGTFSDVECNVEGAPFGPDAKCNVSSTANGPTGREFSASLSLEENGDTLDIDFSGRVSDAGNSAGQFTGSGTIGAASGSFIATGFASDGDGHNDSTLLFLEGGFR